MTERISRLLFAPTLMVAFAMLIKGYIGAGDGFAAGIIAGAGPDGRLATQARKGTGGRQGHAVVQLAQRAGQHLGRRRRDAVDPEDAGGADRAHGHRAGCPPHGRRKLAACLARTVMPSQSPWSIRRSGVTQLPPTPPQPRSAR